MAKSNAERQAEHRARVQVRGHRWQSLLWQMTDCLEATGCQWLTDGLDDMAPEDAMRELARRLNGVRLVAHRDEACIPIL